MLVKHVVGEFDPGWKMGYTYNIKLDGDATGLEVITFKTETDEDGKIGTNWGVESDGGIAFNITIKETFHCSTQISSSVSYPRFRASARIFSFTSPAI